MPGEFSKLIGEIGEDTAMDFLNLIGWGATVPNFDIDCTNKIKHDSKVGTHGIDGYFHYQSPMISNTIENILISVKFSSTGYKSSIVSDFKKDINALTKTIECFKKSPQRNEVNNSYSNINTVFDRGIIFKINNVDDTATSASIIDKLCNIETPTDNNHDGVILIDNERISFLHESISFIKNNYGSNNVNFVYFNTGLNNNDNSVKNGNILPYQYLSSDIIPFRIQIPTGGIILALCYKGVFSEEDLIKLLGIAKNSGINLQNKTVIAFPNYNEVSHRLSVMKVKQLFKDDETFSQNIDVISFNPTFRR